MRHRDAGFTRRGFLQALGAGFAAAGSGCSLLLDGPAAGPSTVSYDSLSRDPDGLATHYDVVVIGSGYGGAIAAARLAPGRRLALLERGREWEPGSFPERMSTILAALKSTDNPLGLFDLHRHPDMDVLVGSGLGGTSLINANVIIEPDRDLFDLPAWPDEIRRDRDSGRMGRLFDVVRHMLQGARLEDADVLRRLPKVAALARGTAAVGRGRYETALQAVNFAGVDRAPNHVGVWQHPCTLCGDCVTGCNVAAKNTLNFNYLPLAAQQGAEIYSRCEAQSIAKLPSGDYEVRGLIHHGRIRVPAAMPPRGVTFSHGPRVRTERFTVRARTVVLGAGSLGSTELLLRARAAGLPLSDVLGQRFSGNADVLGLAYNSDLRTNGTGFGTRARRYAEVGPTIVGIGDFRSHAGPIERRFLVEEGAVPHAVRAVLERLLPVLRNTDDFRPRDARQAAARIARALRDEKFGFDPDGALNHSLVYLGMGHDSGTGRLELHRGRLHLTWKGARREAIVAEIERTMRGMSDAIGGIFVRNPLARWWGGSKLITVHPLGGCAMGRDARTGVVDHRGRVFDPSGGPNAVHRGLYVVDAAILPTPVGVNPLLTISMLAERISEETKRSGQFQSLPE
jgi:cholesterol oxidase